MLPHSSMHHAAYLLQPATWHNSNKKWVTAFAAPTRHFPCCNAVQRKQSVAYCSLCGKLQWSPQALLKYMYVCMYVSANFASHAHSPQHQVAVSLVLASCCAELWHTLMKFSLFSLQNCHNELPGILYTTTICVRHTHTVRKRLLANANACQHLACLPSFNESVILL